MAGHSGRAVWGVGFGRLVAGIVSSNPVQGMDICPRLSVLCCPVQAEALRRADHSSKEPYRMSKQLKKPPICEMAKVLQGL
jgi:hypothetical protein